MHTMLAQKQSCMNEYHEYVFAPLRHAHRKTNYSRKETRRIRDRKILVLEKYFGHFGCMFVCMQLKRIYNKMFDSNLVLVSANCIIGPQ